MNNRISWLVGLFVCLGLWFFVFVFFNDCSNAWSPSAPGYALWWDSWRLNFNTGGSEHLALSKQKTCSHVRGKMTGLTRLGQKVNGTVVHLWQLLIDHKKAIVHGHPDAGTRAANNRLLPSAEWTNWFSSAAASSQLLLYSKCSGQKYKASCFLFVYYLFGHYLHFLIRN